MHENPDTPTKFSEKKKGKKSNLNIIMVSPKLSLVKRLKNIAKEKNTDVGSLVERIIEDWFIQKKKESVGNERLGTIEKELDEMTNTFKKATSDIRKNIRALKTKTSETESSKPLQTLLDVVGEKNEKTKDALEGGNI